ncbi:MAG: threonylcarbamoyl-AMP synthase [Betaproteobacteria bacterium]|nr:threonylcarbamoyl-AMP synthase [Betaproteobacteria bacterium]MDE2622573.1 threonylcarbamoyl-AMP synthase [Betaproteobacteria bacterium]
MQDPIEAAVARLRAGELVAIPTETVYGLAADASNAQAVRKIFRAKNRPSTHPLIVHIPHPYRKGMSASERDEAWVALLSQWSRDVPQEALILAGKFWPGPLTLILPKAKSVLPEVTGNQETVGLRCPDHPLTLRLLEKFAGGLAAPSANRFGRISPTTADHVRQEFSGGELMVLDGGPCRVGIESTIVDLTRLSALGPVILRPGMISRQEIETALNLTASDTRSDAGPRVSGSLSAHYAPRTAMAFAGGLSSCPDRARKIAWVHFPGSERPQPLRSREVNEVVLPDSPDALARSLYALLRELDGGGFDLICLEDLPSDSRWDAIRDRLLRAVNGSGQA